MKENREEKWKEGKKIKNRFQLNKLILYDDYSNSVDLFLFIIKKLRNLKICTNLIIFYFLLYFLR